MSNSDQRLAQIASILYGGYGTGFTSTPGPAEPEMYNTVPGPNQEMAQRMRDALAPMAHLPVGMPYVPTNMGVNEALYSSTTTARQWQEVQDAAHTAASSRMANLSTDILKNLTGKKTLDSAKAAGLLESAGFHSLMGGNVQSSYQQVFANRGMFGATELMNPYDPVGREQEHQSALRFQNNMMGLTHDKQGIPRMGYTQGFKSDQITDLQMTLGSGGRWGHGLATAEGQGRAAADTGRYTQAFKSLSELTGSEDMGNLKKAMTSLTAGSWTKSDFDITSFNRSLKEMAATATLLGRSKSEMIETVATMQQSVQGAMGISAGDIAMGTAKSGMSSPEVSAMLATRAFASARALNQTSPADVKRLAGGQAALFAMGINSPAGRLAQVLEYANQNGKMTQDQYQAASAGLRSENLDSRKNAMELIKNAVGGQGMLNMMTSDAGNRALQPFISNEAGVRAANLTVEGVNNGYRGVVVNSLTANRRTMLASMQAAAGVQFPGDRNAEAEAQYSAIVKSLKGQGEVGIAGASIIGEVWNQDPRLTSAQRLQRVRGQLAGNRDLAEVSGAALKASDLAADEQRVEFMGKSAKPAAQVTAMLNSFRNAITDENRPQVNAAVASISGKMRSGDIEGALKEGNDWRAGSGIISKSRNDAITLRQQRVGAAMDAQYNSLQGVNTAMSRVEAGASVGMSADQVVAEQMRFNEALTESELGNTGLVGGVFGDLSAFTPAKKAEYTRIMTYGTPAEKKALKTQQGAATAGLVEGTARAEASGAVPHGFGELVASSLAGNGLAQQAASGAPQFAAWNQAADTVGLGFMGASTTLGQMALKAAATPLDDVGKDALELNYAKAKVSAAQGAMARAEAQATRTAAGEGDKDWLANLKIGPWGDNRRDLIQVAYGVEGGNLTHKQLDEVSHMSTEDVRTKAVARLSKPGAYNELEKEGGLAAAGRLHKATEGQAGKKGKEAGGSGGGDGKMQLTGTLKMLDSNGNSSGTVSIDAFGTGLSLNAGG